jgi:predicted lactoylglutathione lyase
MSRKIFVNLPVKDLEASKKFYSALGFTIDEQFTDENASCVVVSEEINVMILTEPFFRGFMEKEIADSSRSAEVIVALSADSRGEVDELADRAAAAGAGPAKESGDQGFMYSRSFQDPDGHLWEIVWMDMAAFPG